MSERDPMRWMWRGVVAFTLVVGWAFILWHNKFHIDPPVVIIGLGYLAVVMAISTLWRVGAAAVEPIDDSPESWARPIGPRAELEKEKKTLLKAIKEAEFDLAMGKLSKQDSDDLIRMYRARAIEIIKELDMLDAGNAVSPREKIKREIQARLALEQVAAKAEVKSEKAAAKSEKAAAKSEKSEKSEKADAQSDTADAADTPSEMADTASDKSVKVDAKSDAADTTSEKVDAKSDAADTTSEKADAKSDKADTGAMKSETADVTSEGPDVQAGKTKSASNADATSAESDVTTDARSEPDAPKTESKEATS